MGCPDCRGKVEPVPNNLLAMCQRCHLQYDLELHVLHRLQGDGELRGPHSHTEQTERGLRALALRLHQDRVANYRSQLVMELVLDD